MMFQIRYILLLLLILFFISTIVIAVKDVPFNSIISEKAEFTVIDDVFISNVSHNGKIIIGDKRILPIYYFFMSYDKQLEHAKYVPFTFNLNEKKFAICKSLSKNNDTLVNAVSNNEILVGKKISCAFYWTKHAGIINLPPSIPLDANMHQAMLKAGVPEKYIIENNSEASDISADGNVIIGWCNDRAFLWTKEKGMVGLGCLSGAEFCESRANAISADGKTIVGTSNSPNYACEAFMWTESEGMKSLGVLYSEKGKFGSDAIGVSGDGSIIIGKTNSKSDSGADNIKVFYWTKDVGMIGLDDIEGFNSTPSAVSDNGIIVGKSYKKNCKNTIECGSSEAFIWTAKKGMQHLKNILISNYNLPIEKFIISDAKAISGDGTVIVGNGHAPNGHDIGWIVKLK